MTLMEILRQAIINTAARSPGRRGSYIFDEKELQALAKKAKR